MINFIHPYFLWALAALAIPVILHLINRRIAPRLVFPTLRFITKAHRLRSGNKRLEEWLLLLVRLLILAFLALLFAAPYLAGNTPLSGANKEEVIIFVDLSISMNTPHFHDYITREAEAIMDRHPHARIALLASSNKIEKTIPFDRPRQEIISYLDSLTPTAHAGNHYSALLEIKKMFSGGDQIARTVYLLTDSQRHDWASSQIPPLQLTASIIIVNPQDAGAANVAILNVMPETFAKDEKRRLRLGVQAHNFSVTPVKAKLLLTVGDAMAEEEILMRGNYTEKFYVELENIAANTAIISLEMNEPYQPDNSYHFWCGPLAPITVGIMADLESDRGKQVDLFFLSHALAVALPGMPQYDLKLLPPEYIWSNPLTPFAAVFILDAIANYTEMEIGIIKDYLAKGGAMIYLVGGQAPECLARLLKAGITSARFTGFKGDAGHARSFFVSSVNEKSSITSIFNKNHSDLFHIPIYKFAKLAPASEARVLLTIDDEYPFLIQESGEGGNVFILSTSLAPSWSEFPTSYSFLPLMHQILTSVQSGKRTGIVSVTVGENHRDTFIATGLDENLDLKEEPGVEIVAGKPVEKNLTRRESDLAKVDDNELIYRLTAVTPEALSLNRVGKVVENNRQSLRPHCAWALVGLFFVEVLLANRRQRQPENMDSLEC